MATLNTLRLRKIKPKFRYARNDADEEIKHDIRTSRSFFRKQGAKHTRQMHQSKHNDDAPDRVLVHLTQEMPWTKKRRNRRRNKAARASRKRNR